jgi:hypothetical protein
VTTLQKGYVQKGDYTPGSDRIRYREDVPANQAAKTVCHELAHGLTYDRMGEDKRRELGHSGLEIIAEGAAYMACFMLGFDTSEYSFPYLRSKASGMESGKSDYSEERARKLGSVRQGNSCRSRRRTRRAGSLPVGLGRVGLVGRNRAKSLSP